MGMKESTDLIKTSDRKRTEETFSIFNYFKEHHTLLIATVSAFISIISFLINYASYIYQYRYLQSWNISYDFYINQLPNDLLYTFSFMIVICIIIFIASWKLEVSFISFFHHYVKAINLRYAINEYKKVLEINETILMKKKKQSEELKVDVGTEELLARIHKIKPMIKLYRSLLNRCIFPFAMDILVVITGFVILFIPVYILSSYIFNSFSFKGMIVTLLVYSTSITLTAYLSARTYIKPCTPRRIRKCIKRNEKDYKVEEYNIEDYNIEGYYNTIENFFNELPVRNTKKGFLSDSYLQRSIVTIITSIVVLTFSFIVSSASYTKKSFWIYSDNDSTFAVIFQRPDLLIMEEAEIINSNITIYVDQIKYMEPSNCSLQEMEFETVNKCRLSDDTR